MDSTKVSVHQRKGHIPPPLRRKQGREERAVGQTSQLPSEKALAFAEDLDHISWRLTPAMVQDVSATSGTRPNTTEDNLSKPEL
ncbi:hypothetical protein ATANTOWER_030225 [Ataeniobius toweri]|uniref:Uncharacterized protein n=1 Tax=Ataeniobius toweri TaxID=208326 RepID=A0ABU7CFE0_9TELE|nr:hypothetical protein [Ataeniobius toweri]